MSDARIQLLARKRDIFDALRVLDQDHNDGAIDTDAYRAARSRYELEAAGILERLDRLHAEDEPSHEKPAPWTRKPLLAAGAAVTLLGTALALILISALHGRSSGDPLTGAQPPAISTPAIATANQVTTAEAAVRNHPRDVGALLLLGQAYMNGGDLGAADRALRTATRLDPSRPEPPTLDALVLAYTNRYDAGLALLRQVERRHPAYARAWLTDGLIASRRKPGFRRAIDSWRRFLRLVPHGRVSDEIRASLAVLERARR